MANVIQMRSLASQNADAVLDSTCSTDTAQVSSEFICFKNNIQTTDVLVSFFHTFLFPYHFILSCVSFDIDRSLSDFVVNLAFYCPLLHEISMFVKHI